MTKQFAERLLARPIKCRWIVCPSVTGKKKVAGFLIDVNGCVALVSRMAQGRTWAVNLKDVKYR